MRKFLTYRLWVAAALIIVSVLAAAGCKSETPPVSKGGQEKKVKDAAKPKKEPKLKEETTNTPAPGGPRVIIETDKGKMVIELYADVAPKTVENFKKLISEGFYNGLTFHRVEPGFVIQGGDPNGNGTGGPGYTIEAEFNDKPHVRGTVAMARSQDPDSAGSQFYVALDRLPSLDGNYTVFGQVVEGLETVDKIVVGDKMNRVYLEPAKPN